MAKSGGCIYGMGGLGTFAVDCTKGRCAQIATFAKPEICPRNKARESRATVGKPVIGAANLVSQVNVSYEALATIGLFWQPLTCPPNHIDWSF